MNNIEESIQKLQVAEQEMNELKEKINEIKESIISPLKKESEKKAVELEIMEGKTIDIRLGDLIAELSKLTGISEEEIYIKLDYDNVWMIINNELVSLYKTEKKPRLRLTIASKAPYKLTTGKLETNDFKYTIIFESDFDEIQADGLSLIEHSYRVEDYKNIKIKSSLYLLDTDKEDIICHLKLKDLMLLNEQNNTYQKKLLLKALQNNEKHKKEKAKVKQLKS